MLQFLCWLAPQALQIAESLWEIAVHLVHMTAIWMLVKSMWAARDDDGSPIT